MKELNPAIHKLDSTKLKCYAECPRKFFYEYVLGWSKDSSIHLAFGRAIHEALKTWYECRVLEKTIKSLDVAWEKEITKPGIVERDDKCYAKAVALLTLYHETYKDQPYILLFNEKTGLVPVSENNALYFKMDKIVESDSGLIVVEHKTSGRKTELNSQFVNSFQIGVYLHAAYCMDYGKAFSGVMIDQLITTKSNVDMQRHIIKKDLSTQIEFLGVVNSLISEIKKELDIYASGNINNGCFHQRHTACFNFTGCPFLPFCVSGMELRTATQYIPTGFTYRIWDPENDE